MQVPVIRPGNGYTGQNSSSLWMVLMHYTSGVYMRCCDVMPTMAVLITCHTLKLLDEKKMALSEKKLVRS